MAGQSGYDSIINNVCTNGNSQSVEFQKIGGSTATGMFCELLTGTGCPGPLTFSGTAGVATAMNSSTPGALALNGNVSPQVRNLATASIETHFSTNPQSFILCDFLLYYPSLVVTGSPTTLNNTVTLPRYTNGKGVQAASFVQSALGAATSLTFTYTDSLSGSQTSTQTTAGAAPVSNALLFNSTNPYFAIPSAAQGISSINSYTIGSGTTGTVATLLFRPLAYIAAGGSGALSDFDFLNQTLQLPHIHDGACLGFIYGGSITTNLCATGRIQYFWG